MSTHTPEYTKAMSLLDEIKSLSDELMDMKVEMGALYADQKAKCAEYEFQYAFVQSEEKAGRMTFQEAKEKIEVLWFGTPITGLYPTMEKAKLAAFYEFLNRISRGKISYKRNFTESYSKNLYSELA